MAHLDMFDRLRQVADEYETLEHQLSDPEVLADPIQLRTLSKRYNDLGPVIEKFRLHQLRSSDRDAAREMLPEATGDERELMQAEIDEAEAQLPGLEDELREMMLPKDPYDGKNVVMEIRGAEGGEEANLFARDLYEMYDAYAASSGWKTELLSSTLSDMGGFNEITFVVKGATAWRYLKFEGGPHRVQRVPVTESQGRIHTSSATVTALPEADEVDVSVDDRDLDIDVFRASGPGGQSVNTTDSAVRITHRPTGLVVSMQDERSQLQNRLRAMTVLRTRLFELAELERREEQSDARRSQTGEVGAARRFAPTTSRRIGSPTIASGSRSTDWPTPWQATCNPSSTRLRPMSGPGSWPRVARAGSDRVASIRPDGPDRPDEHGRRRGRGHDMAGALGRDQQGDRRPPARSMDVRSRVVDRAGRVPPITRRSADGAHGQSPRCHDRPLPHGRTVAVRAGAVGVPSTRPCS